MNAKILSYSRARGVFAGIAITGATLRQDLDQNAEMYGKPITNAESSAATPSPRLALPICWRCSGGTRLRANEGKREKA